VGRGLPKHSSPSACILGDQQPIAALMLSPRYQSGFICLKFRNMILFRGWGCWPHAQPQTRGTRPPYLWPLKTGWPGYTPRYWVPILVASYDRHELRWGSSYSPAPTRGTQLLWCYLFPTTQHVSTKQSSSGVHYTKLGSTELLFSNVLLKDSYILIFFELVK
jgi:hypothetical protein